MIEWIIDQQIVLSVSLILLIASEHFLTRKISTKVAYGLWFLIPLVLVCNSLPKQLVTLPTESVSRYVVSINPVSSHYDFDGFLIVWAIGVAFILTFVSTQYIRLYLSINHNKSTSDVSCYSSHLITSPIVFGFIFPKILLPTNFQQLFCSQQQELIVEHEGVHIQHGDHLWNGMALFLLIIFWFNPLVWIGARSFRVSQELACDNQVLKSKSKCQKVLYAKALLQCSEGRPWEPSLFPTMGEKNTLLKRLDVVKEPVTANKILAGFAVLIALVLSTNTVLATLKGEQIKNVKINDIKVTKRIEPIYPQSAIDNQLEGSVTLKFDITESGTTKNIEIVQSFPKGVFDTSAADALAQWEYKSTQPDGRNRKRSDVYVQLDFRLYRRDNTTDSEDSV